MRTDVPEVIADLLISDYKNGRFKEEIDLLLEAADEDDRCARPDWRDHKVGLESGTFGDYLVGHFDIDRDAGGRLKTLICEGLDRDPGWGQGFTRLTKDDTIWMSDTKSEIVDHAPVFGAIEDLADNELRVLINGGGIGVLTKFCLAQPHVTRIDIVDHDEGIIELHQKFYNDPRVNLHLGDAYEIELEGMWGIAWHDIWPDISSDNILGMMRLEDKYKSRVGWQDCWQKRNCMKLKELDAEFVMALERGDWDEVKRIDPDF